jgi:hypothetical protein
MAANYVVALSASMSLASDVTAGEPTSQAGRTEAYRRHGLDPATPLASRVKDTSSDVGESESRATRKPR